MVERAEDEQASDPSGAPSLQERGAALLGPGECQALPCPPLSAGVQCFTPAVSELSSSPLSPSCSLVPSCPSFLTDCWL